MATLYIRRKTGYMSPYSLRMIYGAAVLAPKKYGRSYGEVYLSIGRGFLGVPRWMMWIFRPFNIYVPGEFAKC